MDQDVISSVARRGNALPIQLSATAQKSGWTGLLRGEEEWIEIRRLQPFLRQEFYSGQSLPRMLLTPLFWSIAALLGLLAMEDVFRNRSTAKRRVWTNRGEPSPNAFTRCADQMRRVQRIPARITEALPGMKTRTLPPQSPSTVATESRGQSIRSGIPLFGAAPRSPGEKPIWNPNERDRLM